MKKKSVINTVGVLAIFCLLGSCATSKFNKMEIPIRPVSDNNNYFRSYASGESPKSELARDIAMMNAKSRLASNLESNMSGFTDRFIEQFDVDKRQEVKGIYQSTTKDFFKQKIGRVNTIEEKILYDKTANHYISWVSIELEKKEYMKSLKENLYNNLKDKEELKILYDREEFEKKYNKAYEEYSSGRE